MRQIDSSIQEEIKALHTGGLPPISLARMFKLSSATIYRILTPKARRASRNSIKTYPRDTTCHDCYLLLDGHPKCFKCEILIHTGCVCYDCANKFPHACIDRYMKSILTTLQFS